MLVLFLRGTLLGFERLLAFHLLSELEHDFIEVRGQFVGRDLARQGHEGLLLVEETHRDKLHVRG